MTRMTLRGRKTNPLLVVVSLLVVAEGGCNTRDTSPTSVASTQAEAPSAAPLVPPPPAGEPGITTRAEIGGVHYLEQMMGGAQPDERVPMIVALHPMGGDPADF